MLTTNSAVSVFQFVACAAIVFVRFSRAILFQDPRSCNVTLVVDIPPPLRSGESLKDRKDAEYILDFYWKGKDIYTEENGREYTYGEVTSMGVRQLASEMGLDGGEGIVFYDAGSGVGRLVVQLFLEYDIHKLIGVELSKQRHDIAVESWERVQRSISASYQGSERVEFLNQDILETSFNDTTHIFLSSLCFPKDVIEAIQIKLMKYAKNGSLRIVAALSDLNLLENSEDQRWEKREKDIRMTWGGAMVRIYRLSQCITR
mmetsp:Transcript_36685/g.110152  ORF Transcript_36685/g.110152 Transcript_36685/m.110152 type:complete len:260 (-) Transcript_36685:4-783(-)